MKKTLLSVAIMLLAHTSWAQEAYHPTPENIQARQQFQDEKFGIFLHWGLY
ncbi:MAG: alpha-L-fucosidase, partial [Prevotella sp.]|nr:alpha-L-fucosidase [Prevotella sp.]